MQYFVRYKIYSHNVHPAWIVADVYPAEDWQVIANSRNALNPGEHIVCNLAEVYKEADQVRDHTVIMPDPDELPF